MKHWLRWTLLVGALDGCADKGGGPASPQPRAQPPVARDAQAAQARVVLSPPGQSPVTVRVELAQTAAARMHGLMDRKQLDEDAGMLFLFDEPGELSFWMKNTYIPLDIIFIEPSLRILGIVENAEPLTLTSRSVPGRSQYVLEVNAGFSRRHGLVPGTVVRFEGISESPMGVAAP